MKVIVLLTAGGGKLQRRTVWPHCGGSIVISKPVCPKIDLNVPNQETEDIHLMDVVNIWIPLKDALNKLSGVSLKYVQPLCLWLILLTVQRGVFAPVQTGLTESRPLPWQILQYSLAVPECSSVLTHGGEAELKIWIPWVRKMELPKTSSSHFLFFQEAFPLFVIKEACLLFW